MAASLTVHLHIFKRSQLLRFFTNLDETGIKNHGSLRAFILNIAIIGVAVPFNTFAAKHDCIVEFTVHCQTRLKSKFKGTVDSCLFLTVIRDANLCSLFQNVQGT